MVQWHMRVIVNVTGCGFDASLVLVAIEETKYLIFSFALVSRRIAALNSTIQHAMPQEIVRKWEAESINWASSAYCAYTV